jgi:hypothetical protein
MDGVERERCCFRGDHSWPWLTKLLSVSKHARTRQGREGSARPVSGRPSLLLRTVLHSGPENAKLSATTSLETHRITTPDSSTVSYIR